MSTTNSRKQYRGIVFDMDGTLTRPQNYMFKSMRDALGIDKSVDILKHIQSLPTGGEQEEAHRKIEQIERDAMGQMQPQPGLASLMSFLRAHRPRPNDDTLIRRAICTRNFAEPTRYLLDTFLAEDKAYISPVLTREYEPPKPSPEPLLHICKTWSLDPSDCLMVGDGADDIKSAQAAGLDTVLLLNPDNEKLVELHRPTYAVRSLEEIIGIVKLN